MASQTTRVFSQNVAPIGNTITRLYTAPTTGFTVISQITVFNGSGGSSTFRVYVGAFDQASGSVAGVTPAPGTQRWGPSAAAIGTGQTIVLSGRIVVSNGGWIDVLGVASNFAFAIDAVEVTVTP